MNRIILANLVTVVIRVVGSLSSPALLQVEERVARRTPFSYYVIGIILQFIVVALIRFSHILLLVGKTKNANRKLEMIPALVVRSNELWRKVVHHLEVNTVYRAVAIVGKDAG